MRDRDLLRWFVVLAACVALATTLNAQWGTLGNPGIVPPYQKVQNLTYDEWSAKFWQFAYGIPASKNPLTVPDAEYDCHEGQSADSAVWFLTGKGGAPPGNFMRTCTMPVGKYLFFPIVNFSNDNWTFDGHGDLDWTDYSTIELRKAIKEGMDSVVWMSSRIDGRLVHHLDSARFSIYRVLSPVFHYWLPDDNIFGIYVPPKPGRVGIPGAVGDGVYLMLEPLKKGEHTIEFAASFGPGSEFYFTYKVTVQ